jgi:hypothetical protein
MTWSFAIKNGDLSLSGPGGLASVSGSNKLIQDLRHWLLEPRGTDPMHAGYGSTLDGGTLEDGTRVGSSIGGLFVAEDLIAIEAEVRRVLAAYMQVQADRLSREQTSFGGRNTFSQGEILRTVNDVQVRQLADVALVNIDISTADGSRVTMTAVAPG